MLLYKPPSSYAFLWGAPMIAECGALGDVAGEAGGPILPYIQVTIPFDIIGVGETSHTYCGDVKYVVTCPTDPSHHLQVMKHTCFKWTCPTCYRSTINRASKRVEERIKATSKAFQVYKLPSLREPAHFTFSLPESMYHQLAFDEGLKKAKAQCLTYAQQVGIVGGLVIFHPYRIKDCYKAELSHYLKQLPKEQRKGHWHLVRQDALNLGSWKHYVVYSPHFHLIGFMPKLLEKSDSFHKRTQWVYKNITAKSKSKRIETLSGTVFYLLTHAAYIPGKQVVTYFGVSSTNSLSVERMKEKELISCEHCKTILTRNIHFDISPLGVILDAGHPCKEHYRYKFKTRVTIPDRALRKYIT